MIFRLGLTGSIGMGKSTTAQMFVAEGCAVWDADAAVHRLYSVGGGAVQLIGAAFPGAVVAGSVSRDALRRIIGDDPTALPRIEAIVHPLLAEDRAAFVHTAESQILVFDIPLLFETNGDKAMDAVAVVSAPAHVQRARVLDRATMSEAQFEQILAKQMPDALKRARADYIITTDSLESTRAQVQVIVAEISKKVAGDA